MPDPAPSGEDGEDAVLSVPTEYPWPNQIGPAKRLYICSGCGAQNFVLSLVHSKHDYQPDCAGRPVCVEVVPASELTRVRKELTRCQKERAEMGGGAQVVRDVIESRNRAEATIATLTEERDEARARSQGMTEAADRLHRILSPESERP